MGVLTRNGLTLYEIAGKYHLLKKSLLENFIFCVVSSLTITQVPTKKYWKNPVNFPWSLKENINSALRYIKL